MFQNFFSPLNFMLFDGSSETLWILLSAMKETNQVGEAIWSEKMGSNS